MPCKPTIPRVCGQCKSGFLARADLVKQGRAKFCSLTCRDDARRGVPNLDARKPANRSCEVCGKEWRARQVHINAGIARFCSVECKATAETIPVVIPDDERDLIYLAALVDGEGTITARITTSPQTGREAVHCRVLVANTHEPLMQWLQETFAGQLFAPRRTRSAKHKPVINWYAGGKPSAELCRRLLPYLKVKRRQAEIIIALAEHGYTYAVGSRGRVVTDEARAARQPLLQELRALNHRGVILDE